MTGRRLKNKTWHTIKIIAINWTIFVLLVASASLWLLLNEYREISYRLEVCEHNFEVWNEQVESGKIILELEK